jgi:hypothetical protein
MSRLLNSDEARARCAAFAMPFGIAMLTNEEVICKIESAFKPLRCVAEIWDYDQQVRFRVFDNEDRAVVTFPRESLSSLRNEVALAAVLSSARSAVQRKGFRLDPL